MLQCKPKVFSSFLLTCDEKSSKKSKKVDFDREKSTEQLFAGQNTQHLILFYLQLKTLCGHPYLT